jgi:hypothetical protein
MRAQPAGKESVTVCILHYVAVVQTTAGEAANHHRGPHLQVGFRVSHYDRLAGGSAGGMQAHHLLHWAGKQPEGIGVPQIGFDRERQLADVVD